MRLIYRVIFIFNLTLAATAAQGQQCQTNCSTLDQEQLFKSPLGQFFGNATSTAKLSKDLLETKLTPGVFALASRNNNASNDWRAKGQGLSFAITKGFSEHLGVTIMAATASQGGSYDLGGDRSDRGFAIGIGAVYDYFSGANFRFPVTLGISSYSLEGSGTNLSTATSIKYKVNGGSPAAFINLSPSFKTWDLRWAPFLLVMQGNGQINAEIQTTGGTQTTQDRSHPIASMGIRVIYEPNDILTFSVIPAALSGSDGTHSKLEFYSWTWTKAW
jgi:hypothetical protein